MSRSQEDARTQLTGSRKHRSNSTHVCCWRNMPIIAMSCMCMLLQPKQLPSFLPTNLPSQYSFHFFLPPHQLPFLPSHPRARAHLHTNHNQLKTRTELILNATQNLPNPDPNPIPNYTLALILSHHVARTLICLHVYTSPTRSSRPLPCPVHIDSGNLRHSPFHVLRNTSPQSQCLR
jgi:hypothetical protein